MISSWYNSSISASSQTIKRCKSHSLAPVNPSINGLHLTQHGQQQGGFPTTNLTHDHCQLTWNQTNNRNVTETTQHNDLFVRPELNSPKSLSLKGSSVEYLLFITFREPSLEMCKISLQTLKSIKTRLMHILQQEPLTSKSGITGQTVQTEQLSCWKHKIFLETLHLSWHHPFLL